MKGKEIGVDLVRERTKRPKIPNERTGISKGNFMLRAKVLPPLSFHWDTHPKEGPNLENQAVGGKRGYRVGYAGVDRTLACSDGPGVGGRSKGGEGREIWSWGT